jgi:hypothetical protein
VTTSQSFDPAMLHQNPLSSKKLPAPDGTRGRWLYAPKGDEKSELRSRYAPPKPFVFQKTPST